MFTANTTDASSSIEVFCIHRASPNTSGAIPPATTSRAELVEQLREAARDGFLFRALTALRKLVQTAEGACAIDEPAGEGALIVAAASGHAHIVQALLGKAAEHGYHSTSVPQALMEAVGGGHRECVSLLRHWYPDDCEDLLQPRLHLGGHTPLSLAAAKGHLDVVLELLSAEPVADPEGGRFPGAPLVDAADQGYSEVVDALLEHGADVDSTPPAGHLTAMQSALHHKHWHVCAVLASHGASLVDVESTNDIREISAHAIHIESEGALRSVLERAGDLQADLDAHLEFGTTLLTSAVLCDNTGALHMLLKHGTSVDGPDSHGDTALIIAVALGRSDAVRMLLKHGANPNAAVGAEQGLPLQLAVHLWAEEMGRMAEQHGLPAEGTAPSADVRSGPSRGTDAGSSTVDAVDSVGQTVSSDNLTLIVGGSAPADVALSTADGGKSFDSVERDMAAGTDSSQLPVYAGWLQPSSDALSGMPMRGGPAELETISDDGGSLAAGSDHEQGLPAGTEIVSDSELLHLYASAGHSGTNTSAFLVAKERVPSDFKSDPSAQSSGMGEQQSGMGRGQGSVNVSGEQSDTVHNGVCADVVLSGVSLSAASTHEPLTPQGSVQMQQTVDSGAPASAQTVPTTQTSTTSPALISTQSPPVTQTCSGMSPAQASTDTPLTVEVSQQSSGGTPVRHIFKPRAFQTLPYADELGGGSTTFSGLEVPTGGTTRGPRFESLMVPSLLELTTSQDDGQVLITDRETDEGSAHKGGAHGGTAPTPSRLSSWGEARAALSKCVETCKAWAATGLSPVKNRWREVPQDEAPDPVPRAHRKGLRRLLKCCVAPSIEKGGDSSLLPFPPAGVALGSKDEPVAIVAEDVHSPTIRQPSTRAALEAELLTRSNTHTNPAFAQQSGSLTPRELLSPPQLSTGRHMWVRQCSGSSQRKSGLIASLGRLELPQSEADDGSVPEQAPLLVDGAPHDLSSPAAHVSSACTSARASADRPRPSIHLEGAAQAHGGAAAAPARKSTESDGEAALSLTLCESPFGAHQRQRLAPTAAQKSSTSSSSSRSSEDGDIADDEFEDSSTNVLPSAQNSMTKPVRSFPLTSSNAQGLSTRRNASATSLERTSTGGEGSVSLTGRDSLRGRSSATDLSNVLQSITPTSGDSDAVARELPALAPATAASPPVSTEAPLSHASTMSANLLAPGILSSDMLSSQIAGTARRAHDDTDGTMHTPIGSTSDFTDALMVEHSDQRLLKRRAAAAAVLPNSDSSESQRNVAASVRPSRAYGRPPPAGPVPRPQGLPPTPPPPPSPPTRAVLTPPPPAGAAPLPSRPREAPSSPRYRPRTDGPSPLAGVRTRLHDLPPAGPTALKPPPSGGSAAAVAPVSTATSGRRSERQVRFRVDGEIGVMTCVRVLFSATDGARELIGEQLYAKLAAHGVLGSSAASDAMGSQSVTA